jgi:acetyltransferase (GNAT) family protein
MSNLTYRWIDGHSATTAEWDAIDQKLAAKGWMSLSRELTRVRVAERDDKIVGMAVLQHIAHIEPLLVDRSEFGTGVAERLADDMISFMNEIHARGYMAICEHPAAVKLCEDHGMIKVTYPVYISVPEGG